MRTISIVLKEGRINFQDANGNVQSINVLSDTKTTEMIRAITDAGNAAIETIERITPDIPAIEAEIDQLGKDITAEAAARTTAVSSLNTSISQLDKKHGNDVTRLETEIANATPKDYESVKQAVTQNSTAIGNLESGKADKTELSQINADLALQKERIDGLENSGVDLVARAKANELDESKLSKLHYELMVDKSDADFCSSSVSTNTHSLLPKVSS